MDPETNHQANHQFRRLPKGERRVRFADSMGMELVSIFLFDLINTYYFASIHNSKHQYLHPQLQPLPAATAALKQPATNPSIKPYAKSLSSDDELASWPNHNNNNYQNSNNNNQQQKSILAEKLLTPANHRTNHNHLQNQPVATRTTTTTTTTTNPRPQLQKQPSFEIHQDSNQTSSKQPSHAYICEFTQPISLISFKERVKINKVHLETCCAQARAGSVSISCTIRVLNKSFNKSVLVRYTTDEWHTFVDCQASYKPGSSDGWSDSFSSTFIVPTPSSGKPQERIIFAIRYTYEGNQDAWDNNGGLNYVVKKY